MKTKLVRIGKSKGIRLPKAVINQLGSADEIEFEVRKKRLILHCPEPIRKGWAAAFARTRARDDDQLLELSTEVLTSSWDETEWKW